ncbi:MAG: zinc ribbon domain-containing protein [Bacillota bacterium]|nr:zinc ribbon domain-containing protein [Candidatus Fermentithermobacillaceae bacterium]HAF66771.1 FmdB family transcriptional regulator [Clostridiales bacterium UBA9857]HOA71648.1 zinc ribbon domain-containing protein [Bacillota bacterium]HOP70499.1 zinc ribbon domain-containing protein [Bacillota bacterium]HPT35768.1 zinc ribbon domain-containing protein [Bacillota bacterium]
MPIFEYRCKRCGKVFECLVRKGDVPACPECGSEELTKLMSMFATNVRKGSGGQSSCAACTGGSCSSCRG